MNPNSLLDALQSRLLLCDGAMGTQLIARGLQPGACGEKWNVERPDAVEDIHLAYRLAGCDLITTNTFGCSEPALLRHDLARAVRELNRAGAQIAAKVAGSDAWVLGDVGPFGGFLEPVGDMDARMLQEIFRQQCSGLYEGGADAIIVETMSDPMELAIAVQAARDISNWPIIATYSFNAAGPGEFRTMMGSTVAEAVEMGRRAGANIIGANCGTGISLEGYVRLAEQIVKVADDTPVIMQPNAGQPEMVEGKLVYRATPADMAAIVRPLLDLGVKVIGGCCGTSPEHLRAMRDVMR